MRSLWLTLAILPVLAQSSSQDPIIRVSVDLVQLDATVTDSAGRHVADLRPEDCVILEDGKPQTVTHFSYVAEQLASLAATAPKAPAVQPSKTAAIAPILTPAKPIAATQVRRTIVLIADDLGLSADDIPNTRKAMKAWIDREMEPGDMLSVVTTSGGIGAMEQLTNDRAHAPRGSTRDRLENDQGTSVAWYRP
jgi:VWFA-related protein